MKIYLLLTVTILYTTSLPLKAAESKVSLSEQPRSAELLQPERIPKAELVWFEPTTEENHIYHAWYDGRQWKKTPTPVVTSSNSIATPILATTKGEKVLIWSEARQSEGMDLMYASARFDPQQTQSVTSSIWTSTKELASLGSYNLGANAITDLKGQLWVFWSSDYYESSDIFMIRRTTLGWTSPELIHESNTVPDINIQLELSETGEVTVIWQSLDVEKLAYVEKRKIYPANDFTVSQTQLESLRAKEDGLEDLSVPAFVPKNQRLIVHFPNNHRIQSKSAR